MILFVYSTLIIILFLMSFVIYCYSHVTKKNASIFNKLTFLFSEKNISIFFQLLKFEIYLTNIMIIMKLQ